MADLGELLVRLDADADSFRTAMQRAEKALKSSNDNMSRSLATLDANVARSGQRIQQFGRNASAGFAGLRPDQLRNLGFQLNDVVTQVASGQSVFRALAQQGGQVVDALGGITVVLGAMMNPIGLAIAAVAAVAGGVYLLTRNTDDASGANEKYAETLKEVNELLATSEENTKRLAEAKQRELAGTLQSAAGLAHERLARLDADRTALESTIATLEKQNPIGKLEKGMRDTMLHDLREQLRENLEETGAALGQIAEAKQKIDQIFNPKRNSKLGEDLFGKVKVGPDRAEREIELQKELEAELEERADREKELIGELDEEYEASEKRRKEIGERVRKQADESLKRNQDEIARQNKKTSDAARDLGLAFSSAFEDAIVRGKSFREVLSGIEQDIARIIIRKSVTEPAAGALSGLVSAGLGALGGMFGGAPSNTAGLGVSGGEGFTHFGGPRAAGGPVAAGVPYMVGEAGRELFVPSVPGTIVPHDKLGGGGGVTVVQSFNISTGVAQTVRAEMLSMMPAIQAQTLRTVQDAQRRNRKVA